MAGQSPSSRSTQNHGDSQQDDLDIAQLRQALRESELRFRTTLNAMGDAIHIVDTDWQIVFFNTAFTRWDQELGLPTDVVGRTLFDVFPFLSDKVVREYEQVVESGDTLVTEEITEVHDQVFVTETRKIPLFRRGKVFEVVTVVRNLTDIRRTEETLERTEKWLRRVSADLLDAKEEERKRMSVELHDRIGQSLAAIKYKAEAAVEELREDRHAATRKSLELIVDVVRKSFSEFRRIELDLQPPDLTESGIGRAVSRLCEEFEHTYPDIQFEKTVSLGESEYPDVLKIAIYRIIQAALTNVVMHGHADTVRISLTSSDSGLELVVQDNGKGFRVEDMLSRTKSKRGLGLGSMNERARLSGGTFSVESEIGVGTTVRAVWKKTPA